MAKGIQLDTSIRNVGLREGYADQINPAPFVNAYNSSIRAGQQLQDFGGQFAEFTSKQAAIENDNYVNNQLINFEKEKVKVLNYLTTDPKAKEKLSPSQYGQYITDKLTTFRSKQLTKIPQTRLEAFKLKTEQSLMSAQASALTHMKKINDDEYDATTLRIRENILENAANPNVAFDYQTALNNFQSRLGNGVVANVYDEATAAKKLDKFKEDLADTTWNRRESEALNDKKTTLDSIMKMTKEISKDPDLDPKMKFKRTESLLNRFNTRQSRQRKLLEDVAKEKEFASFNRLSKKVGDERHEKLYPNEPKLTNKDIDYEINVNGYRDELQIQKFRTIANRQEALQYLGDPDNEPDKGYLDDIKKIELNALRDNITDVQLDQQLMAITNKARKDNSMTSVELTKIDGAIATVTKDFKDEGKSNLANAKTRAKQAIRRLYGGSDQFMKKFNMQRENLVNDAYNTARLLIEGGERWDVAVEKIRPLAESMEGVGIQRFRGVTAKDLVMKARKGQLDDSDRFVLEAMAARRSERDDTRQKNYASLSAAEKTQTSPPTPRDLGLKNK